MKRIQFPLAPEEVRTAQTAQGMTFKRCLMFLERPGNMGMDDWWFHVYVMLSRVRCIKDLLVFGLPPRALLERGPPAFIRNATAKLEAMAVASRSHCATARSELGWPALLQRGDSGGTSASVAGASARSKAKDVVSVHRVVEQSKVAFL